MELAPGTLEALGLTTVRVGTAVLASPLLGFGYGFSGMKIALVAVLSFVIFAAFGEPLPFQPDGPTFAFLALREMLIGFFLGFIFQATLLSVQMGGELIGNEMGMFMARQVDPDTGIGVAIVSKVYENFFLLALLSLNGHHMIVRAMGDSLAHAPIGVAQPTGSLGEVATRLVGQMFGAGIAFAAPVMIFLMLTSLLIGLLSRAVPQLNIMELSFTLRIILALVAMYLFAPLLETAMSQLHEAFSRWLGTALSALGA